MDLATVHINEVGLQVSAAEQDEDIVGLAVAGFGSPGVGERDAKSDRRSEDLLLRAGHAFQITDWHTRHPALD